ncbi:drug transporter [Cryptococcus neoformans C23]|uniref:Drug transporter n=1 Tax=Cryptococcus neoformans (strain H99 / ATCC 208821 / CBS 10515 / FGSC 9487) TaxID=235443 RepID=J9VFL5_CRYN9|nr:drug transporter [Cryptococcus neoformans var. grubii H99]AFR92141.1 drug transporter [Cryptococcus neoformans var. grubii H99]AUB21534.1 drug transporter [Cryptococcus neoformans var. grubii]OWZ48556.1 drug transporter [Cryptococcus neoformans var. grubii C23]|eukprot:XP_012046455.1 drug transporter [Cryptococcus neoformans var. grubii H99]
MSTEIQSEVSTLAVGSALPPGCSFGSVHRFSRQNAVPLTSQSGPCPPECQDLIVIWVDFPPQSPEDPFHFSSSRKVIIMILVLFFAFITTWEMSSYSVSTSSMRRDFGVPEVDAALGLSLYGWGFAVGPLVLAPITEEYGRYLVMVVSVVSYTILHLMLSLGKNISTILVGRFLLGLTGCIGPTLTPGFIADIYPPEKRGSPMAIFTFILLTGPAIGAMSMGFVEANQHMQWRWVQWIQLIIMGVFTPLMIVGLRETRSLVVLQRQAKRLRKERALQDGGRYTARAEINRMHLLPALKRSIGRPFLFLFMEPIVTSFALWTAVVWGVYFIVISGLPYVFSKLHGWNIQITGVAYLAVAVGSFFGFLGNFAQDAVYRRRAAKDGTEARLWASMVAGVLFAIGCFVFGASATSGSSWFGPCAGVVLVLAAAFTILQCCLVYLANCYGAFASSAVAGMSFLRILLGSSFAIFTENMFNTLTVRYSLIMMGGIAMLLAPIPFVMFFKGPWIRDHSPYSKRLIAEEQKRLDKSEINLEALA